MEIEQSSQPSFSAPDRSQEIRQARQHFLLQDDVLRQAYGAAISPVLGVSNDQQCEGIYGIRRDEFVWRSFYSASQCLGEPNPSLSGMEKAYGSYDGIKSSLVGLPGEIRNWDDVMQGLQGIRLVGLNGKISCGKDTVAQILAQDHQFVSVSFAASLKRMCVSMYDIDPASFDDRERKEKPLQGFNQRFTVLDDGRNRIPTNDPTPRQVAQIMGTEVVRDLCRDFWVRRLAVQILQERMKTGADRFAISDVRFPNEGGFVLKAGGIMVEVQRPHQQLHQGAANAFSVQHASERGLGDLPRVYLNNDAGLDELRQKAGELAQRICNTEAKPDVSPDPPPHERARGESRADAGQGAGHDASSGKRHLESPFAAQAAAPSPFR